MNVVLDDGTTVLGRVTRVKYIWNLSSRVNPHVEQILETNHGDIRVVNRVGLFNPGKTSKSRGKWTWSNVLPIIRSSRKPNESRKD
jgi:hypothetical protein